jgi:hypothetical protein
MENFKVSSRLYILLAIAAAAFSILLLIAQMGMAATAVNLKSMADELKKAVSGFRV